MSAVNCNMDDLMIAEQLRPKHLNINRSEFKKSEADKINLLNMEKDYTKLKKNKEGFLKSRQQVVQQLSEVKVPKFGALRIKKAK